MSSSTSPTNSGFRRRLCEDGDFTFITVIRFGAAGLGVSALSVGEFGIRERDEELSLGREGSHCICVSSLLSLSLNGEGRREVIGTSSIYENESSGRNSNMT